MLEEPPSTVGCRLARLGHSIARVKISGAAPFRGRNMVFRKKFECMLLHYLGKADHAFPR